MGEIAITIMPIVALAVVFNLWMYAEVIVALVGRTYDPPLEDMILDRLRGKMLFLVLGEDDDSL